MIHVQCQLNNFIHGWTYLQGLKNVYIYFFKSDMSRSHSDYKTFFKTKNSLKKITALLIKLEFILNIKRVVFSHKSK